MDIQKPNIYGQLMQGPTGNMWRDTMGTLTSTSQALVCSDQPYMLTLG